MTETQIMRANHELDSKLARFLKLTFKPYSAIKDLEEIGDNCDYSFEEPKLKEWAEAYCFEAVKLGAYGYGAWKAYEFLRMIAMTS